MSFLPPTSNYLVQEERNRLVKSTRKLTELLGTTPRLVETVDEPRSSWESTDSSSSELQPTYSRASSRASNRSARVFSSSRASFISFEDLSDSENDDELSTPDTSPVDAPKASLQLNTSSAPNSANGRQKKFFEPSLFLQLKAPINSSSLSLNLPSSAADNLRTAVPPSPLSPLSPMDDIHLDRRRRMAAKLTRTLGESIPPELIVAPPTARPRMRPSGRSQSHEEPRSQSFFASQQDALLSRQSKVYEVVNIHIPSNIAKYQAPVQAPDSTTLPVPKLKRGPSSRVAGKEWSGEWNHDMQDVMQKLRGLKA